jgi:glycosyltransferase involved in cell wall biosynthesis
VKVVIVVEAIPPYCGGGEHVAWIHAVEMAKTCDVSVVTFGDKAGHTVQEGVSVYTMPKKKHALYAYSTTERAHLNECVDQLRPDVIHCHMPNILSVCIDKRQRLLVSTIHDGTPENELLELKRMSGFRWMKFKILRRMNIHRSDLVTCVSQFSLELMRGLYPKYAARFSFIPNPVHDRFFAPTETCEEAYILNYGRQIELKMGSLLEVAKGTRDLQFVFVGTGEMVRDHGLPNVNFVGFCDTVEKYIDGAAVCVFPSLSENFPLVGLESMARGKAVIATRRGFSEYIRHMENGFLLGSADPSEVKAAIKLLMDDPALRHRLGENAKIAARNYRAAAVVDQYSNLYRAAL